MTETIWFALALIIGWLVYQLLPYTSCTFIPRLAECRISGHPIKIGDRLHSEWVYFLPAKWRKKIIDHLTKAGFSDKRAISVYLGFLLLIFPLLFFVGLALGWRDMETFLIGLAAISALNAWISRRLNCRQRAFTIALYKIYRFLDLQLSAGLKMTDSLKGLSGAVQDKTVQPILVRFSARYELTLDFDQAFTEIRDSFGGTDCELMATHLRQCLQTGEAGRSLQRMEELLFARYFNLMQADSQKIRLRLLMTALLAILPAAILFMLPLLYQAMTAMQSIFG